MSTDTHFTHKAWHDTSETIQKITYPMIGDPTGAITRNFDVMIEEEGLALRGTFVINPEGVIKVAEIHDLGIGRDAKELLRKVQAAQYVASHPGEVCPAKWTPGDNLRRELAERVDALEAAYLLEAAGAFADARARSTAQDRAGRGRHRHAVFALSN